MTRAVTASSANRRIGIIALDATTVAAQRGPPQTSPLFEEAGLSAANDG